MFQETRRKELSILIQPLECVCVCVIAVCVLHMTTSEGTRGVLTSHLFFQTSVTAPLLEQRRDKRGLLGTCLLRVIQKLDFGRDSVKPALLRQVTHLLSRLRRVMSALQRGLAGELGA